MKMADKFLFTYSHKEMSFEHFSGEKKKKIYILFSDFQINFCAVLVMLTYVEKCKLKKRLLREIFPIWFSNI